MQNKNIKEKLSRQRCVNHAQRETVARCPDCQRHFCRECITEHNGKLLCKHCLHEAGSEYVSKNARTQIITWVLALSIGFFIALFFFYTVTKVIASIPQQYHRSYLGL